MFLVILIQKNVFDYMFLLPSLGIFYLNPDVNKSCEGNNPGNSARDICQPGSNEHLLPSDFPQNFTKQILISTLQKKNLNS